MRRARSPSGFATGARAVLRDTATEPHSSFVVVPFSIASDLHGTSSVALGGFVNMSDVDYDKSTNKRAFVVQSALQFVRIVAI